MPLKKLVNWMKNFGKPRGAPSTVPVPLPSAPGETGGTDLPRHFGDLWHILQEIAREEDPKVFSKKMASEHAAESVEGKKDVERWLEIYRMRVNPEYKFRFPEHHVRYRGFCLIPRHWPDGTRWEAFHDETVLKASVQKQATREDLMAAIDRWLEEEQGPGAT